jgi:hypothetical protein
MVLDLDRTCSYGKCLVAVGLGIDLEENANSWGLPHLELTVHREVRYRSLYHFCHNTLVVLLDLPSH